MESTIKGFFVAAFAALVAGLGLLLFEDWYFDRSAEALEPLTKEIAITESRSPIELDGVAQYKIAESLANSMRDNDPSTASPVRVAMATISNVGTAELTDFKAQVFSSIHPEPGDILALGLREGNADHSRLMKFETGEGEVVDIPIDLLKPGEDLSLWFLMSPYNIAEVSVREPEIQVLSEYDRLQREREKIEEELRKGDSDGFGSTIFIILFSIAGFAAGAGIVSTFYDNMLKTIGIEPKEVMEAYEEFQKSKKASG